MKAAPLLSILLGAALLLLGRRLFWLFVAGVGFVVGAMLATEFMGSEASALIVVIALAVGILAALVSIFLQRLIVGIAGFLAGGYLLHALASGLNYESFAWIAFLVGGVIGAILIRVLFDWALIALSALMGAAVIAQNLSINPTLSALLFCALVVLGAIVQARQLAPAAPGPEKAP
jgi:hypothetical protein